jgi:hypothetical protein
MTQVKFPKQRKNGSFTVFCRFEASKGKILGLVRDYVNAWAAANRIWVRIWRGKKIRMERWKFYSEFRSKPRVEIAPDGSGFSVVFEGRPGTKRWKDWVVMLVKELSTIFHEIKFIGFDS